VRSDHGFTSFRWEFFLNDWLRQEGYLELLQGAEGGEGPAFKDIDWSRTRAYGLGLNGLYLNLRGREPKGIVYEGAEADRILREIEQKLLAHEDARTGGKVVRSVVRSSEVFRGGAMGNAPDLLVGYEEGYRASWKTVLGDFSPDGKVLSDNLDKWSGDHCIDPAVVPGVLFTDRPVRVETPTLADMAPTILSYFGVEVPEAMEGRDIFGGGE
jgi:predicted AlkP superfamily phosphohydrolase/phosphomutase